MAERDVEIEGLLQEVREMRHMGCVVAVQVCGGTRSELLGRVGYRDIGAHWVVVDPDEAQELLWWILHRDLAYSQHIAPPEDAAALAARLCARLGPGAWYTNGDLIQHCVAEHHTGRSCSSGWSGLSGATFDSGVLFEGPDRVVIVWVEDED